jgi:hypothetical protein
MTDNNIQGKVLSLFPKTYHPFPLSAEALAKVENLFLAFIFLLCKKINAFQVFVKHFSQCEQKPMLACQYWEQRKIKKKICGKTALRKKSKKRDFTPP